MSTAKLESALQNIDKKFREKILAYYLEIKSRYSKALYNSEYDSAGLSAGKFCEAVLRLLQNKLTGTNIPFGTHIPNFNDECQKIMNLPKTSGNESLRLIIPRSILFLYTLRGKRGIGHVGGDVEANRIDIETIVRIADWTICEIVRIYHGLSLEEAQAIVDAISMKSLPYVWEVAGKKRILATTLNFKQKTLLLLYHSTENYEFDIDLCKWVEYSSFAMFKTHILNQLHDKKLIEYDKETSIVYLSPIGIQEAEKLLLNNIKT